MSYILNKSFLSLRCLLLGLLASVPVQGSPMATQNISSSGLLIPTMHPSRGGNSTCVSGTLPITASTNVNVKFKYNLPQNQSELTQIFVSLWTIGSTFRDSITTGVQTVGGTYNISTTVCFPTGGPIPQKVQVLTHGIGFDGFYWDFAPGYSYVDAATAAGYTAILYDRLGIGGSSKDLDPIQTIQSPIQLAILANFVQAIRQGHLLNTTFSTVVGVGHSFGSAITQGLAAENPQTFDAVVLTGTSTYAGGMPAFSIGQNTAIAALNDPYRFSNLSTGFTVIDTEISNQITFFHAPGFDPSILSLAAATKATTTLGEFLTTMTTVKTTRNFTNPVAVVDGDADLGFCFGNCSYSEDRLRETITTLFPALAENKTATYMVPMTGHGVNLHYEAQGAFEWIMAFLKGQGL